MAKKILCVRCWRMAKRAKLAADVLIMIIK